MSLPLLPPLLTFLVLLAVVTLRYWLTAGLPYLVINVLGSSRYSKHKISPHSPSKGQVRLEIGYSMLSNIVFAVAGTILIFAWRAGFTRIYLNAAEYGWFYLPISFAVYAFAHETYFYWTHRWMHVPKIFIRIHAVHHRSVHPTAWASFSFHPLEALIQALFLPVMVMMVPIHPVILFLFLLFMTVLGVINHLGYEIYPPGFASHFIFRNWISATHHQMHHERFKGNYGLYFTFWDRWQNTDIGHYSALYSQTSPSKKTLRLLATRPPQPRYDWIILGAGLWGSLLAYLLSLRHPNKKVLLLDAKPSLQTGDRTWSFHHTDLDDQSHRWIAPLVSKSWPCHELKFPSFARSIPSAYYSIRSSEYYQIIESTLAERLLLGQNAAVLDPWRVQLSSGEALEAHCVIDARGWKGPLNSAENFGFQKFVGLDLKLASPHGLQAPTLMDATVPQKDGYRFVYLLPWDDHSLLIEDTHYSDSANLLEGQYEQEIIHYANSQGWQIDKVLRKETGVLPIPLFNPCHGLPNQDYPVIGMRAGCFHDTTGYSLPDAVRVVELISDACTDPRLMNSVAISELVTRYCGERSIQRVFLRVLNRMLFKAALPERRFRVFEHFYRLPQDTVLRFYAGQLRLIDGLRILCARPPVSITRALQGIFQRKEAIRNG